MFLMGGKQRSLKEIIAKNIGAIGYLEGEHVLYFMNLSPGSRIQTRMLGNCGSKIGSAVMHFSYARHSGEERKKWLSLSCTQVPTLVMTSSQRGPAGSAATRLTRPARHSTGREMKIFYYFYSRCICKKTTQIWFLRVWDKTKWRAEMFRVNTKRYRCSHSLLAAFAVELNNECYYEDQMFGS